jgi:chromosome segregation ATPase
MRGKAAAVLIVFAVAGPAAPTAAVAQDVPGIEACTKERALDRRTGCLQSNVEYLQQVVSKQALDTQQKLAAAGREAAALRDQLAAHGRDLVAIKEQMEAARAEVAALKSALAAAQARLDQLKK